MKIWKEPKRVMWEPIGIDSEPLLHGGLDENETNGGFHFSNSTLKRTKKIRGFDNMNFMFDPNEEENSKCCCCCCCFSFLCFANFIEAYISSQQRVNSTSIDMRWYLHILKK